MLYLVQGTVRVQEYMHERSPQFDDIRLVYAESKDEARGKWEKFWRDQSSEYSISYSPWVSSANPAIE